MWHLKLELHKKGGSTTNVQSYTPTAQEVRLQEQAADYSEAVAPNALWLNTTAREMLEDSMGTVKVDYNALANNAMGQITQAQQGVAGLTQGQLPAEYQANMEAAIKSGVENTVGSMVNSLGARGVLNSSVTDKAIQGINDSVANTMAQNFTNNIGVLNGLYGQQASLAGQNIATAAGAQEAAANMPLQYWQSSLGLNSGGTLGALNAMSGQGTTTTTANQSGGTGLFGGLATSLAGGWASNSAGIFCFTDDTKVKMADGEEKYIRHIKEGDKVLCYNELGDSVEEVVYVQEPVYQTTYAVVAVADDGKKNVVYTTLAQPLLADNGEYQEVQVMRIGTRLKGVGKVTGIVESGERKVYDFQTTGNNKYYANGFIAQGAYAKEG
jgi:hypothetical protein